MDANRSDVDTLAQPGAEVEVAPLPAGDDAVGAETVVERKRVLDLHAAVLKGRLWAQRRSEMDGVERS